MEDDPKAESNVWVVNGSFPLGYIVATPGVELKVSPADIVRALARHARGDWGELCEEDRDANEMAVTYGGRVVSVYRAEGSGERFYVITEADRSVTTLLLPDEY
jgi:hypothetical protein